LEEVYRKQTRVAKAIGSRELLLEREREGAWTADDAKLEGWQSEEGRTLGWLRPAWAWERKQNA
jgi:hypothetical protein